ncbi:MAG: tetratricopeptide repeat protein [Bacteroidota bacterium]|uniref:Tetratricopeptide repeat protein n=1 Tax=Flagellimonas okinawensis TaxID=3031324 RepID=A0ABT5XKE3_9FLAO|nr:tetratricopeptide repeat protein [[Muricauda] okinawensis]MDF0706360.1 tetratricopeptide repeat protein [[Muricauda] okinawensis]MEC8833038.1 tetratricopeptide repeat protein [Bacteroidota bacterium]
MALESNEYPDKSISKFESMLKTDDVYFFDAEDFEEIIHHYLNNGKISLGKKAIQIGLEQHPNSMELKLLQVEVLAFEDKFEAAETLLDEIQNINAANEEIYIQRANIRSKQDKHQEAVNLLLEALDVTDHSFDIHSLLGMEYLFMDNYEQAKLSFMRCVEMDDRDYSSLYNVIYCFEFLEDFDGSIHYLNDYLERNPYSEVAWHQLGKMYLAKSLYLEALTAFDFAVISDDSFIGAYFEKGKVLEKLGRYNEAIENYESTISIEDPTSYAFLRLGKCHEKLGNFELAKYYYYHTVHEDPLLDKGWLAITDFHYGQKNFEKALYYINKAINIDGENPKYWKKAAKIYSALNNFDEADFAYKQSVDLGNYELGTWKNWAEVLYKIGDLNSAIQVLIQGLEFYPDNSDLTYKLAGIHLKNKDLDEAKSILSKAMRIDIGKLQQFEKEFPEFIEVDWVKALVSKIRKTAK